MGEPRLAFVVAGSCADTGSDPVGTGCQERLDARSAIQVDDAVRLAAESGRTEKHAFRRHRQEFRLAQRAISHEGTRRNIDLPGERIPGCMELSSRQFFPQ